MSKNFWINKPVSITQHPQQIQLLFSAKDIKTILLNDIHNNPFGIQYKILNLKNLDNQKIDSILDFINTNYVVSNDDKFKLIYSKELFTFYAHDSLLLEFYPKNNDKNVIGYIIGKRSDIVLFNQLYTSSEVNFLCIIPKLRNLKISSYMINVLSYEILVGYNILISHYTIGTKIKAPPFSIKPMYHRILNIPTLYTSEFIKNTNFNELAQIFNTFQHPFSSYRLQYFNYNPHNNSSINKNLVQSLYKQYIEYANLIYDLYENVSFDEFERTFCNNAFHHFIIYNKNNDIVSYVCLFRLDTCNISSQTTYRSGYYYYMFFKNNNSILHYLEFINEYIYKNDIFDMITFTDIFNIDIPTMKCIKGTGQLSYYFYNLQIPLINNTKNGLITI